MNAEIEGSPAAPVARLLRDRSGLQRVTNIELFFDLVYVFAVTQLSHHLLSDPTLRGALQSGLLLLGWVVAGRDTTWVTRRARIRADGGPAAARGGEVMLISLAMSAGPLGLPLRPTR